MKIKIRAWQAVLSVATGIIFTMLLSANRYEYCMCGDGYGYPFAIIHPWHSDIFFIRLEKVPVFAPGIDIFNIILNIIVLALTAYLLVLGLLWTGKILALAMERHAQN